jgi:hypothetical protein
MSFDVAPLEGARQHLGLSVHDLWWRCLGLGGLLDEADLADSLHGHQVMAPAEYDVVAQALNEAFMDAGDNHPVAYSDEANKSA